MRTPVHANCMIALPMSHAVQVRNVPDDVHRALKRRADSAGLSLSQFLLIEITRVASRPPIGEVLERAAASPGGASFEDAIVAVRADRDEHDDR